MPVYCGMPALLQLCAFGEIVQDVFGARAYLVGSSLTGKGWRDLDVRVVLDDEEFDRFFGVDRWRAQTFHNGTWEGVCMAFSALGREMTNGLPVDFQVQCRTRDAGLYADKPRYPLCRIRERHANKPIGQDENDESTKTYSGPSDGLRTAEESAPDNSPQ